MKTVNSSLELREQHLMYSKLVNAITGNGSPFTKLLDSAFMSLEHGDGSFLLSCISPPRESYLSLGAIVFSSEQKKKYKASHAEYSFSLATPQQRDEQKAGPGGVRARVCKSLPTGKDITKEREEESHWRVKSLHQEPCGEGIDEDISGMLLSVARDGDGNSGRQTPVKKKKEEQEGEEEEDEDVDDGDASGGGGGGDGAGNNDNNEDDEEREEEEYVAEDEEGEEEEGEEDDDEEETAVGVATRAVRSRLSADESVENGGDVAGNEDEENGLDGDSEDDDAPEPPKKRMKNM